MEAASQSRPSGYFRGRSTVTAGFCGCPQGVPRFKIIFLTRSRWAGVPKVQLDYTISLPLAKLKRLLPLGPFNRPHGCLALAALLGNHITAVESAERKLLRDPTAGG